MTIHSIPSPEREPLRPGLDASIQASFLALDRWAEALSVDPRLEGFLMDLRRVQIQLEERCRQMDFVRQVANILGATTRIEQLASLVMDVLRSDFGAHQGVVWSLGGKGFIAREGMGFDRRRLDLLHLPAPQPFPGYPLLSYQCQWLDPQGLPPALGLIQCSAGDALFFIPFEHQMLLTGFALLSMPVDRPFSPAEIESLEILQRLFASSLYHAWMLEDLRKQREGLQQQTNAQKEQAELLERQNQALRQGQGFRVDFLAYASKELRSQMLEILMVLGRARDSQLREEERSGMLLDGLLAGKHMAELLMDLLELARPGKTDLSERVRPMDLSKLLEELKPIVEAFPRHEGLVIHWPRESVLPDVLADEETLRQILLSLCAGALDSSGGATLDLWLEREPMSLTLNLLLEGLHLGHLAESFNRRDLKPEEMYIHGRRGTGLGLVICRQLMEAMGGSLRLHQEEEGRGTILSLDLVLS